MDTQNGPPLYNLELFLDEGPHLLGVMALTSPISVWYYFGWPEAEGCTGPEKMCLILAVVSFSEAIRLEGLNKHSRSCFKASLSQTKEVCNQAAPCFAGVLGTSAFMCWVVCLVGWLFVCTCAYIRSYNGYLLPGNWHDIEVGRRWVPIQSGQCFVTDHILSNIPKI